MKNVNKATNCLDYVTNNKRDFIFTMCLYFGIIVTIILIKIL